MLPKDGSDFSRFAMLYLDEDGKFVDNTRDDDISTVPYQELPQFFKKVISEDVLSRETTDVFVWVHGWQNDELRAITNARKLFANIDDWFKSHAANYKLGPIVPAFVGVHWPSTSLPGLLGYKKIRNRAKAMTTKGEAELFLASLLGYLDADNQRKEDDRKILRAKGGYYVHCLGHSFGGRFLTAAIKAAAAPEARRRKILAAQRETGFPFNIDSLCVFQMAAGASAFKDEFSSLLETSPLCGPIVLTRSSSDKALCVWHQISEGEPGIGCNGAAAPAEKIGNITLKPPEQKYLESDFAKDITNVDASALFVNGGWAEGGHSDFWHPHSMHLIASIVEQVRAR